MNFHAYPKHIVVLSALRLVYVYYISCFLATFLNPKRPGNGPEKNIPPLSNLAIIVTPREEQGIDYPALQLVIP